jgi:hypothetical protein
LQATLVENQQENMTFRVATEDAKGRKRSLGSLFRLLEESRKAQGILE